MTTTSDIFYKEYGWGHTIEQMTGMHVDFLSNMIYDQETKTEYNRDKLMTYLKNNYSTLKLIFFSNEQEAALSGRPFFGILNQDDEILCFFTPHDLMNKRYPSGLCWYLQDSGKVKENTIVFRSCPQMGNEWLENHSQGMNDYPSLKKRGLKIEFHQLDTMLQKAKNSRHETLVALANEWVV